MDRNYAKFDGGIPQNYDDGLGPHIFEDFGARLARQVADSAPGRVLELAAGTGIVSRMLRDTMPSDGRLTATDLNEGMLEVARQKFSTDEQVEFRVADAQSLPFEDSTFDVIACQFGIMFFPDKQASMREALRVLRPGGKYVFNVWSSFEHNPFARLAHGVVETLFPNDTPGFYKLPFSYDDCTKIESSLRKSGFDDVSVELCRIDKQVADFELFAQGIVFGNPIIEEIRERGVTTPEAVKASVVNAFREVFGPEPATMPLRSLLITASARC